MSRGIPFDMQTSGRLNYNELKDKIMKNVKYESPSVEIINLVVDQPILTSSFAGEDINEWEDM